MPIIPNDRPLISTDVSTGAAQVNPAAAGSIHQAIGNVGAKLTDISLNLLEDVKRSEAIQASHKTALDDEFAQQDMIHTLKTKYANGYITNDDGSQVYNPDGTPRTITQEFRDWANDRFQKNQSAMPSKLAQEIYVQKAGTSFTDSMIKVRNDELIQRTQYFKDSQASQLKMGLNRLVDTPDVNAAYTLMDGLNAQIAAQKGVLLSHGDAFKNQQLINKETPQSLFNGLLDQAIAEPKETLGRSQRIQYALDVLHGMDQKSVQRKHNGLYTISDSMDPDQKAEFERKFLSLEKTAEKLDMSDLNQRINDAMASLRMGERVPIQPLLNDLSIARAKGKLTDYEFSGKIGPLIATDAALPTIRSSQFFLASPEEQQRQISQVMGKAYGSFTAYLPQDSLKNNPQIGGTFREHLQNAIQDQVKSFNDSAKTDFAQAAQIDKAVAGYTGKLDFSQPQLLLNTGSYLKARNDRLETLGDVHFGGRSPDFRYISKEESQQLGWSFKDPNISYGNRADGLKALYAADQKRYGAIISQMVKDNSLDAAFRIAPVTANRLDMQDFFRTVFDGKAIREDALKVAGKTYTQTDFDSAVQTAAGAHLQAMAMANTDSALREQERSQIRAVITTKAMDLYRQEGGAQNPSYYAQKATETLLDSKQTPVSVGGMFEPGLRTQFLIPKVYQGQPLTQEQQANARINRNEFFRSPEGIKSTGAVPPLGMEDLDPKKFYEQVARTGALTPAEDGNGYNLKYYDMKANKYVRAITDKKDRNGKPIPVYISTGDLIKSPAARPDAPKPDGKGFIQKLTDAFHFEAGF